MANRNRYDQDEVLETPFNWEQVKRVFQYVKPYKVPLIKVLTTMVLSQIISLLGPMILQQALDKAIPNKDYDYLIFLSSVFLAIVVLTALASRYRIRNLTRIGQDIIHDIRLDMFKHLQRLPFDYFDSRPHGKISTRVINYVNRVNHLVSNVFINVILEFISLIIIIIYMFIVDWRLTLYAMIGLPILILYMVFIRKKQRRAQQIRNNKNSNLNAYSQESVQGMQITQLFGRESVNRQIYHGLGTQLRKANFRTSLLAFMMAPVVRFISKLTVAFLYIAAVFWLRQADGSYLPPGTIVAMVSYIGYFWGPIANLSAYYNQILAGGTYVERIFEFLDEPVIIEEKEDAYDLPEIEGRVKFDHVNFYYEEGNYVLKDVDFEIEPGQSVALVGPTGAGKSTIVNLLARFYDVVDGRILVDGHDIRDVTLSSLRGQLGIMMQDPYLFPVTIMENIRYGRLDATDEECIAAAKAVHAHEFIMRQPDGYQTEIHERGSGVSAGEKQLISIARVMVSNPKLVILDEATSSVDTQTEQALQKGIAELTKGRTTFSIAHRLSTIRNSDIIFYIANEGIAEAGTHEELLLKGGLYASLYEQQLREMLESGEY